MYSERFVDSYLVNFHILSTPEFSNAACPSVKLGVGPSLISLTITQHSSLITIHHPTMASNRSSSDVNHDDGTPSVFSRLRNSANIEADRARIEQLASKRAELQKVLQMIIDDQDEDTGVDEDAGVDISNEESAATYSTNKVLNNKNNFEKMSGATANENATPTCNVNAITTASNKANNGYFYMPSLSSTSLSLASSRSSFFFMEWEDTKNSVERKLQKVETELMDVCNEVQRTLDGI